MKLSDVSSFFVDSDNSVLFADIPGYIEGNHGIKAKSSSTKSVSLESLIDRDKAVERTYKSGLHLLQIPFKANDYSDYAYVGADTGTYVSKDSLSVVKKFIIVAEDPDGTVDTYVATMISRPEYLDIKEEQDISYLFLGNFSGLILESKLDGELICATYSENGQVFNTAILKEGETKPDNCETFVLGLPVYTKGDADWRLRITTPAECIAYRNTETAGPLPPGGEDGDDQEENTDDEESDQTEDSRDGSGGQLMMCNIDLSVNNPKLGEVFIGIGLTSSGRFYVGTTLFIDVRCIDGSYFSHWNDMFYKMGPSFTYALEEDVTDIAMIFDYSLPCWDSKKGVINPIFGSLHIEPSSDWNMKGGLFGSFRKKENGDSKPHYGIDIAAPIGTPIYAMADGIINNDTVTVQVNRIAKDIYPPGYKGKDRKDAGNRISYDCVIDNEEVTVECFHLMEGNAVAINPRTGKPFEAGDEIYQGERIAYVGITGNANRGHGPHLHLGIKKNGEPINPEPYINGTLTPDASQGGIYRFTDVKCDEIQNTGKYY